MLRRVAQFFLWLGFFALFLFGAAYTIGERPYDLICVALPMIALSWLILRRPQKQFEASRRFRTLRRLGLTGKRETESKG
jgi:hypothetical protein